MNDFHKTAKEMLDFIEKSPTCFHAVVNIGAMLEEAGYVRLRENEEWKLVKGGKYYTERNDSSVIAFAVPTGTVKGFHMAAAHSDSPCFKVKESPEMRVDGKYTKLNTEVYGGMLNAIGLQNPGIDLFIDRDIPFLKKYDTKIIVNVCGKSVEDYVDVVERLGDEPAVSMLEINVSCPNVKEGGIAFGQNPKALEEITKEVKKYAKQPVIMKLSPNVTDITEMAKAAEAGGADVLSLINTLTGMKIDINRRTFALANKTGGMSGPAVKPVAVRMVYQVANAVSLPIIGMGGIATAEDALEFIMAGATAVSVGTANFFNPYATVEIADGIQAFLEKQKVEDINELIGVVK